MKLIRIRDVYVEQDDLSHAHLEDGKYQIFVRHMDAPITTVSLFDLKRFTRRRAIPVVQNAQHKPASAVEATQGGVR